MMFISLINVSFTIKLVTRKEIMSMPESGAKKEIAARPTSSLINQGKLR